jgi:hypothetical protein
LLNSEASDQNDIPRSDLKFLLTLLPRSIARDDSRFSRSFAVGDVRRIAVIADSIPFLFDISSACRCELSTESSGTTLAHFSVGRRNSAVSAVGMGPDDGSVAVRAHHAGDGVHMDDGPDGLYPLLSALVLARQRDYARQLSVAYTHTVDCAANMISFNVLFFWTSILFVFWLASLGAKTVPQDTAVSVPGMVPAMHRLSTEHRG